MTSNVFDAWDDVVAADFFSCGLSRARNHGLTLVETRSIAWPGCSYFSRIDPSFLVEFLFICAVSYRAQLSEKTPKLCDSRSTFDAKLLISSMIV
jgi:hypothetical protein